MTARCRLREAARGDQRGAEVVLVPDLPEVGNDQMLGLDRLLRTPERPQLHAEVGQGGALARPFPGSPPQPGGVAARCLGPVRPAQIELHPPGLQPSVYIRISGR
ncbi:hypothetical protein ACFVZ4_08575 [Streptomyces goshikiensis]|uniref:hypothetical protein n=1 Tax=Streptomyces goshikiensis TaxID=1942 RepID=UPI00368B8900